MDKKKKMITVFVATAILLSFILVAGWWFIFDDGSYVKCELCGVRYEYMMTPPGYQLCPDCSLANPLPPGQNKFH